MPTNETNQPRKKYTIDSPRNYSTNQTINQSLKQANNEPTKPTNQTNKQAINQPTIPITQSSTYQTTMHANKIQTSKQATK